MRIGSTWETPMGFEFHIEAKNRIREMMAQDPDACGSALTVLKLITFNKKLTIKEKNDEPVPNEEFIAHLIQDYKKVYKKFKPGIIEKTLISTVGALEYGEAINRNDIAYTERIGGCVTRMTGRATHKEIGADPNGDYLDELKKMHIWWNTNDKRERTRPWIDWVFRFLINKYQTDNFYKQSINFFFHWVYKHREEWEVIHLYNPEYWFGNGRGKQLIEVYGGDA